MEGTIIASHLNKCANRKIMFFTATCFVLICFTYRHHKGDPVTPSAKASAGARHLQTDHQNGGKSQVEEEISFDDMSMSDFANTLDTLKNYSLNPKELQEVNQPRDESTSQRTKDSQPTVDEVVNLIKSISNLTASDVIEMLTQNLNSTKSDLRFLYQKLHKFQEEEKCPACLSKRTAPITFFGTEAQIEYNQSWAGHKLPVILSDLTNGRLGNQMAAYATIFAIKEVFNVTVLAVTDAISELRRTFPRLTLPSLNAEMQAASSAGNSTDEERDDNTEWIELAEDVYSTPSFISLQMAALGLLGPKNFFLSSYPFEFQLFHAHRAKIQREFRFNDQVIEKAKCYLESVTKSFLTESKKTRPVLVGVHVRLDDYAEHMAKVFGVEKLDYTDYLRRSTDYFESLYDNVVFVVASDDVRAAMEYFVNRGMQNVFFPSVPNFNADHLLRNSSSFERTSRNELSFIPRLPDEDMSLLTKCNHSIITLGTFGFFSAYLGSGAVLYPDIVTKTRYPTSRVFYEKAKLERFIPIPM